MDTVSRSSDKSQLDCMCVHCRLCGHARERQALGLTDVMVELKSDSGPLWFRPTGNKVSDVTSAGTERQREDWSGAGGEIRAERKGQVKDLLSDKPIDLDEVTADATESPRLEKSIKEDFPISPAPPHVHRPWEMSTGGQCDEPEPHRACSWTRKSRMRRIRTFLRKAVSRGC